MIDAEATEIKLAPMAPTQLADLRESTRATLLIRSAKLICQSGEYVCLVRDVSAVGVRLRLFHPLPPETWFFLALANGENYPMESRWSQPDPAGGAQAGFRFVQPIDVASFIEEAGEFPRRPIRLSVECHGQVFSDGRGTPMVLRNLSQAGARIETTTWLALHQTVRLVVAGLPERFARIRWRNRYDHGLAFDQAFRLEELAAHARVLQPFAIQPTLVATELATQPMAQASG